MRFKISILISFFSSILTFAAEVHPLGIVIRPNLVRKVIAELNSRRAENRGIRFPICSDNRYFEFSFLANWSDAKWVNLGGNRVYLSTVITDFKASGKYFEGCQINSKTGDIEITAPNDVKTYAATLDIQQAQFGFQFDPQTMFLEVDRKMIATAIPTMTIQVENAPAISDLLNPTGIREALLNQILDVAQSSISKWLKEKLRGLAFVQSAGEVLKDNPIWKAGTLIDNGAITMEFAERNSSQQFLTFAFNPFKNKSAFATPNGLELYFNADFLDIDQLRKLSGINPTLQNSGAVLEQTRMTMADPAQWSDATFDRPELQSSSSDLSLVIPGNLMDDAWTKFYRERLLNMRLTGNIGRQTKGLITDEEEKVHYRVTISPQTAPRMLFQPDRLRLEVENYVMDFKTLLEDREIPSTQIESQISVGASLGVDPQRRIVKMVLDPSQFSLKLRDLKNRFSDDEMLLFENIAKTIWHDFLKNYAEFEIFPTVMDTGNLPIEIQRVSVTGSSVVLDINLLFRGATP
jgi:hypothetical protein